MADAGGVEPCPGNLARVSAVTREFREPGQIGRGGFLALGMRDRFLESVFDGLLVVFQVDILKFVGGFRRSVLQSQLLVLGLQAVSIVLADE